MKPKILIVDDEPEIGKVISMCMRPYYKIIYKSNGNEALNEIYESDPPDVILADIDMPECDGYTLVNHIKQDHRFKHIPVIMISNLNSSAHRSYSLKVGAEDYLAKPLPMQRLKDRIGRYVETSEEYSN